MRKDTSSNHNVLLEISVEFNNLGLDWGLAGSQCPCHDPDHDIIQDTCSGKEEVGLEWD